jgi:hypothetical protein
MPDEPAPAMRSSGFLARCACAVRPQGSRASTRGGGTGQLGLPRLKAALDAWLHYLEDPPFAGGCFLCTTTIEYGAKPGNIRDALAIVAGGGLELLREQVRLAQRLDELPADPPAEQLVFELHAFLQEANWARRILDDATAIDRARTAIAQRLDSGDSS